MVDGAVSPVWGTPFPARIWTDSGTFSPLLGNLWYTGPLKVVVEVSATRHVTTACLCVRATIALVYTFSLRILGFTFWEVRDRFLAASCILIWHTTIYMYGCVTVRSDSGVIIRCILGVFGVYFGCILSLFGLFWTDYPSDMR